MNGLILNKERSTRTLLKEMCIQIFGKECEVDEAEPESIDLDDKVSSILDKDYNFIILPLTLPHYLSLRFGERVHLKKSQTRLILCSNTGTEKKKILKLFDGFCSSPCDIDELREAFKFKCNRLANHLIEAAISDILSEAKCFEILYTPAHSSFKSYRQPTIEEYRSTISNITNLSIVVPNNFNSHIPTNQPIISSLPKPEKTVDNQTRRFKIALSFPSERRNFVEKVATLLANRVGRNRVLYDKYYEAEFARPDLDTYLQHLYHAESELIAVFLCADYERKDWCGLEWRAILDLIKQRQTSTVMPLRFDDTAIPGLFSIDGYVWIGGRSPQEIADLILQRMGINTEHLPTSSPSSISTPPAPSPALKTWREKLDYLEEERAITADPALKFELNKQIAEAKAKIREFGGSA